MLTISCIPTKRLSLKNGNKILCLTKTQKIMQHYNTTRINGTPMPLLMGFTPATKIQEAETEAPALYDPFTQTVAIDARTVGTRSLKTSQTLVRGTKTCGNSVADKKNEIDDQKNV